MTEIPTTKIKSEIILITNYGKAGTFFIHSLLDSHPDIISFPPVYTSWFIEHLLNTRQKILNVESAFEQVFSHFENYMLGNFDFISENVNNHHKLLNMNHDFGFNQTSFKELFVACFDYLDNKGFDIAVKTLTAAIYAFDLAINNSRDIDKCISKKIVFQLHQNIHTHIDLLNRHFEKVHLIQMVRSPLISFRSHVKHLLEQQESGIASKMLYPNSLEGLLQSLLFSGDKIHCENINHFGVSLERLHKHPVETMTRISDRLGIDYHPALQTSTFGGNTWGNFTGKEFSLFNPDRMNENIDISDLLPQDDANILGTLLLERFNAWDYQSNFEIIPDVGNRLKSHRFFVEYLAYFSDKSKLRQAYLSQRKAMRTEKLNFFLQYFPHHKLQPVELIL